MNTRLLPLLRLPKNVGDDVLCINRADPTLLTIGRVVDRVYEYGSWKYSIEIEVYSKGRLGIFKPSPRNWDIII